MVQREKGRRRNGNRRVISHRSSEADEKEHFENGVNIERSDIQDDSYDYQGMMANVSQIVLFNCLRIPP